MYCVIGHLLENSIHKIGIDIRLAQALINKHYTFIVMNLENLHFASLHIFSSGV